MFYRSTKILFEGGGSYYVAVCELLHCAHSWFGLIGHHCKEFIQCNIRVHVRLSINFCYTFFVVGYKVFAKPSYLCSVVIFEG